MPATGEGGGRYLCKSQLHPHPLKSRGESFYRQLGVMGLHAEIAPSSLTVIFRLVISGLTSIILVVLGTINLQFQGPFVPISFCPTLRIVVARVLGTVWSSCG